MFLKAYITKTKEEQKYIIILIIFSVLLILKNAHYIYVYGHALTPDESSHLTNAYQCYKQILNKNATEFFFPKDKFYPSLIYQTTALLYYIIKPSNKLALLYMNIYLLILLFSMYGIGLELFDENIGFLSAVISTTFPFILSFSHEYMLDLPLASLVALAIYLLIKSENFTSPSYTILFFFVSGIGLLVKWTFPIYLILPFGYTLLYTKAKKEKVTLTAALFLILLIALLTLCIYHILENYIAKESISFNQYMWTLIPFLSLSVLIISTFKKSKERNILIGFVLMLTISWGYYALNLQHIPQIWRMAREWNMDDIKPSTFAFFKFFVFEYQGILTTIMLLIGILYYIIGYKPKKAMLNMLLVNMFLILILMRLYSGVQARYFLPIIPLSIPFATFWIFNTKPFLKYATLLLLFLTTLLSLTNCDADLLTIIHKGNTVQRSCSRPTPTYSKTDEKTIDEMTKYITNLADDKICYLFYVYTGTFPLEPDLLMYKITEKSFSCDRLSLNYNPYPKIFKATLMLIHSDKIQASYKSKIDRFIEVLILPNNIDAHNILDKVSYIKEEDMERLIYKKEMEITKTEKAYIFCWEREDEYLEENDD